MNPTLNRILHIIGIITTTAVALVVPIAAQLPPGSTWAIRIGALAGVLSTLQKAFGSSETNAAIKVLKTKMPFVVLAFFALGGTSCAWWQKTEPAIDCAALATVNDAPQLVSIVETCIGIAVNPAAVVPCVEGAAASKWTNDVIGCFTQAAQGKLKCPAYETGKAGMSGGGGKITYTPGNLGTNGPPYLSYKDINGVLQQFPIPGSGLCVVGNISYPSITNFVVFTDCNAAVAFDFYEGQRGITLGLDSTAYVTYTQGIGFRLQSTQGLYQYIGLVGAGGTAVTDTKGVNCGWSLNPNTYIGDMALWWGQTKAMTISHNATLTH